MQNMDELQGGPGMSKNEIQDVSRMGLSFAPLRDATAVGGGNQGHSRESVGALSEAMGRLAKDIAMASMPAAIFEGSVPGLPSRPRHSRFPTCVLNVDAMEATCTSIRGRPIPMFSVGARRYEATHNIKAGLAAADTRTPTPLPGPNEAESICEGLCSWPGAFPSSDGNDNLAALSQLLSQWWNNAREAKLEDPVGDLAYFLSSEHHRIGAGAPQSLIQEESRSGAGSRAATSSRKTPSPEGESLPDSSIDTSLAQDNADPAHSGVFVDVPFEDLKEVYDRLVDEHGRCKLEGRGLDEAIEEETMRVQGLFGDQSLTRANSLLLLLKLRAAKEAPVSFARYKACADMLPRRSLLLPLFVHMQVWQDTRSVTDARKTTIKILLDSLGIADPMTEALDKMASALATDRQGHERVRGWAEGLDELSMAQEKDLKEAFDGAAKKMLERVMLIAETLKRERNVFIARQTLHPAGGGVKVN